jgi:hypothetical protein
MRREWLLDLENYSCLLRVKLKVRHMDKVEKTRRVHVACYRFISNLSLNPFPTIKYYLIRARVKTLVTVPQPTTLHPLPHSHHTHTRSKVARRSLITM